MEKKQLENILEKHSKYLCGKEGGERVDLHGADLRGANLHGANLRGTACLVFYGPRSNAYALTTHIQIGCEQHTPRYWLENYKTIGASNGYSESEIEVYGDFIRMACKYFKRVSN